MTGIIFARGSQRVGCLETLEKGLTGTCDAQLTHIACNAELKEEISKHVNLGGGIPAPVHRCTVRDSCKRRRNLGNQPLIVSLRRMIQPNAPSSVENVPDGG